MSECKLVKIKLNNMRYKSRLGKLGSLRLLTITSVLLIYFIFVAILIQPGTTQEGSGGGVGGGGGGGAGVGVGEGGGGSGDASVGGVAAGGGDSKEEDKADGDGDGGVDDGDDKLKNTENTKNTTKNLYWRRGYEGHGTTHEMLGQPHFPPVVYTHYVPKENYTEELPYSSGLMYPFYNVTHFLFDKVFTNDKAFPKGYVIIKDKDTLGLGPKVEQNDWHDLLSRYWVVLLWIVFWLFWIILIPFLAVCYFCFCCCRRCSQGCPPCDHKRDACLQCYFGILLLLLLLLLLLGLFIAIVSGKLLDRGFKDTSMTMRRGSEDTCRFFKHVGDHLHHIFVNNYQELETHIMQELREADKHIFLDLVDVSGADALKHLERIFLNMPEALKLMSKIRDVRNDLKFYTSQLRDALRGVKTNIFENIFKLCSVIRCQQFLYQYDIGYLDAERSLHIDELPATNTYNDTMTEIVDENYLDIIQPAMERLKPLHNAITILMKKIIPLIESDLRNGREVFSEDARKIQNIINSVISDIHLHTLRTTKSYEDVYDKFGPDRNVINYVMYMLLILILIILIIALIIGCCWRSRRGYGYESCNKSTGSSFLVLAMVLIFMVFSFIALIGLFYFMIGLVTYHGACAPLRDREKNAQFRQLDSSIDLHHYVPKHLDNPVTKMRLSKAITLCEANRTIFQLLREIGAFDINNLQAFRITLNDKPIEFSADWSEFILFDEKNATKLMDLRDGYLSSYHSKLFTNYLSTKFSNIPLLKLSEHILTVIKPISTEGNWKTERMQCWNDAYSLRRYDHFMVGELKPLVETVLKSLSKIDQLILHENEPFGQGIERLVNAVIYSQEFIQKRGVEFINALSKNLTAYTQRSVSEYVEYVVKESNENVGHCGPLAYFYHRSVEFICHRLVDPLNAFWLGVLLSCLALLPILWVAHKLICLYRRIGLYTAKATHVEGGCPICTGAPYIPPPILTCGGGQQASCACGKGTTTRGSGGAGLSFTKQKIELHEEHSSSKVREHNEKTTYAAASKSTNSHKRKQE